MKLRKISSEGKDPALVDVLYAYTEIAFPVPEEVVSLDPAPALPIGRAVPVKTQASGQGSSYRGWSVSTCRFDPHCPCHKPQ